MNDFRVAGAKHLIVAAILLPMCSFGVAHLIFAAPNSVVTIDGASVLGGDPPKFACNNLCKQNEGAGCVLSDPNLDCTDKPLGSICGEEITDVFTVMGCEENPAGGVDPCVNGEPPEKCYKAKNCVCDVRFQNGQAFGVCITNGAATERGDTVGSSDC